MDEVTLTDDVATETAIAAEAATEPVTGEVLDELLVEEISIDGMCGVY